MASLLVFEILFHTIMLRIKWSTSPPFSYRL